MHYHLEVWVPEINTAEEYIAKELAPYCEELLDEAGEYHYNEKGWWDWYEIGGRYTGAHGNYNPAEDARNFAGGKRNWSNAPHESSIVAVTDISSDVMAWRLILGEKHFGGYRKDYEDFPDDENYLTDGRYGKREFGTVREVLDKLNMTEGYLVTVDCHG